MYIKRNIEARSCNHCCSGKAISIACSKYVYVALGIQHVIRMRRIIFSSVAYPALTNISIFSHKRQDFRKKKKITDHKMCVLIFSTNLSETFLILRRYERDMIKKCTLVFM